jgi:drug/metabolite transporter (DMT)-like permease
MSSTVGEHAAPGHATTRPGVWLTELSLVAMALIWGVNYSVVKFGASLVDPLAYNGVRVALAAALLLLIVVIEREPLPPMRTVATLLALGVLGNGVYQFLFIEGIARTRASDAALVVAATPAFVALIGRARGVERITSRDVLGIVLSVAGIALVVLGTTRMTDGSASLIGDLLVLAGSLAWAMFTVLLKPHTENLSGMQVSAFTMMGGALVLVAVATPSISSADWGAFPAMGWAAFAYSTVFALVIAYYFWYRGVRVIGPTRTAVFSNLQPVIAMLMAWAILHETPTAWQTVGAVSIMTGLLLTRA